MAYDLFGNGRTALKASFSKFVEALSYNGVYGVNANPIERTVQAVNRAWNDGNRNFQPDCDLLNPLLNGECGQISNLAFGNPIPSTNYDPTIIEGWGKRGYSWEGSVAVQHEVVSNVSAEVGVFPALVRQLPDDGQPVGEGGRLRSVQRSSAGRQQAP